LGGGTPGAISTTAPNSMNLSVLLNVLIIRSGATLYQNILYSTNANYTPSLITYNFDVQNLSDVFSIALIPGDEVFFFWKMQTSLFNLNSNNVQHPKSRLKAQT
jgi:hypothetical protein